MSDEADTHLIREMRDAAGRIKAYIGIDGREDFLRQEIVYDAVCMNLLRVGECARSLSDAVKARLPHIPWPDIVSLRNRLAHGYDSLKPEVLWMIASVSLPALDEGLRVLSEPA